MTNQSSDFYQSLAQGTSECVRFSHRAQAGSYLQVRPNASHTAKSSTDTHGGSPMIA